MKIKVIASAGVAVAIAASVTAAVLLTWDRNGVPRSPQIWDAQEVIGGGSMPFYIKEVYDPLPQLVARADGVAVVKANQMLSTDYLDQLDESRFQFEDDAARQEFERLNAAVAGTPRESLWDVGVEKVIKGDLPSKILILNSGGRRPDGTLFFSGGDVQLEEGRTYIVLLHRTGPNVYSTLAASRSIFDITTGKVLVANTGMTGDLEQYEGLKPQAFEAVLAQMR